MVELTLKWDKFGLCRGLHDMLACEELVDVTIVCQGEFLYCHRNVLAASSPQFREIFKKNPSPHPIMVLKGIDLCHLKSMLQFMYLGEVTVSQDELPEFLTTADEMGITALSNRSKEGETFANMSRAKRKSSSKPASSETSNLNVHMECESEASFVKVEMDQGDENADEWDDTIEESDRLSTEQESPSKHDTEHYTPGNDDGNDQDGSTASQAEGSWFESVEVDSLGTSLEQGTSHQPQPSTSKGSKRKTEDFMPTADYSPFASETVYVIEPEKTTQKDKTKTKYRCFKCPEKFSSQSVRTQHELEVHHEKGAQVVCDICDKEFIHAGSLASHRLLYHVGPDVGMRHVCKVCKRTFVIKAALRRHERNVHGDFAVTHKCALCGKKFKNRRGWLEHVALKHKNKNQD